jgi:hypothetical protein
MTEPIACLDSFESRTSRSRLSHHQRGRSLRKLVAREVDGTPKVAPVSAWARFAQILTCCTANKCLKWAGKDTKGKRQAWREKVALCFVIALISGSVLFITLFLQRILCPDSLKTASSLAVERIKGQGMH